MITLTQCARHRSQAQFNRTVRKFDFTGQRFQCIPLGALRQARNLAAVAEQVAPECKSSIISDNTVSRSALYDGSSNIEVLHSQNPYRNETIQHQPSDLGIFGETGAGVFTRMLQKHGVEHIFGLPPPSILDALSSRPKDLPRTHVICPKHEQGAGHMAEGYARASGRPGVVFISTTHGLTNMVTPIQDALSDGTPMVVFFEGEAKGSMTSPPPSEVLDVIGITRSCTKWNVAVQSADELPRRINEAFEIAMSGKYGPVLVDLRGCSRKRATYQQIAAQERMPNNTELDRISQPSLPRITGTASRFALEYMEQLVGDTLRSVAHRINNAERPVIYAGQGVLLSPGGPELLAQLAHKCSIPVTTTLMGLGAFDETDEKALHMLGLHGTAYANMAIQEADLIIALGARFDDRVTMNVTKFAPKALAAERAGDGRLGGIVQFEIAPKNINKVVQATEAVEGDVATNLGRLLPQLEPRAMDHAGRVEWFSEINAWKKRWPLSHYERTPGRIMPQTLMEQLSTLVDRRGIKDRTYISTGVGQHQMWAAQYFRWQHPRTMITSGGLGTMGYGLPAAIGAKLAQPKGLVIDIDGDASLAMTVSELLTASHLGIDVKIILLNNEEQGMVTQIQNVYYEDRYAHSHQSNPDFVRLARAMGVQSRSVSTPNEVNGSLEWLIDTDGPALLEIITAKKVPVLPTVPAGRGLHEFIAFDEVQARERRDLIRSRTSGLHG